MVDAFVIDAFVVVDAFIVVADVDFIVVVVDHIQPERKHKPVFFCCGCCCCYCAFGGCHSHPPTAVAYGGLGAHGAQTKASFLLGEETP